MKVRLEFKPQNLWISVYWEVRGHKYVYGEVTSPLFDIKKALHIWICIIPMLPIHVIIPLA